MRNFKLVSGLFNAILFILVAAKASNSGEIISLPVQNGDFDDATGGLADNWNDNGGSIRGGSNGGFGWDSSYFVGPQPTGSTFASTVNGPVRQDLSGPFTTFTPGWKYTLTADLFSAGNYGPAAGGEIAWTIALTADSDVVSADSWYSDELSGSAPIGRVITVNGSTNGLTSVMLEYVATAADDGKTIGIQLGGNDPGGFGGEDYYGMLDNVALSVSTPEPASIAVWSLAGLLGIAWYFRRRVSKRSNVFTSNRR